MPMHSVLSWKHSCCEQWLWHCVYIFAELSSTQSVTQQMFCQSRTSQRRPWQGQLTPKTLYVCPMQCNRPNFCLVNFLFNFKDVKVNLFLWAYLRTVFMEYTLRVIFMCIWYAHNTVVEAWTRMWADVQRDGRPAEYRWRPLFNAAKFGWRPILECRAVTLPRRETRWN